MDKNERNTSKLFGRDTTNVAKEFAVLMRLLHHFGCSTPYIFAFTFGVVAVHEGWFNRFFGSFTVTSSR